MFIPLWLVYLFSVLIGILLVGTRVSVPWVKYVVVLLLIGASVVIAKKLFIREEIVGWMDETWGFTKKIALLLLAGVGLVVGHRVVGAAGQRRCRARGGGQVRRRQGESRQGQGRKAQSNQEGLRP